MTEAVRPIVLDDRDFAAVRALAFADHRLEPFPAVLLNSDQLARLVDIGLAETGESCRPAVGAIGYRLTAMGWQVAARRWSPAPSPPLPLPERSEAQAEFALG